MRAILALGILILLPLRSYALKTIDTPTPVLHSVFNQKPITEHRQYTNISISVEPVNNPGYSRYPGAPYGRDDDRQRRVAKALVVAGSIVTLVGAGFLIALVSDPGYDYENGAFGLEKVATIGLCAIIICGLGMLIPGIIMRMQGSKTMYK